MPTSQPLGQLTTSHRAMATLVAYSHGPRRSLLEEWRRYRDRQPPPRPRNIVVELPAPLRN
jgi:hypothetical protein